MNSRLRKSIQQILLASSTAAFAVGAFAALGVQNPPPGPGQVPDYFGVVPNYANSPQPVLTQVTIDGDGNGAQAVATTYDYATDTPTDKIMDVQLLNGGSGYTTATATVTDGGGATVALTPTITNGVITGFQDIPNPLPTDGSWTGLLSSSSSPFKTPFANTGIRKFVDSLPSLNSTNNLGQSLPVATPTTLPDGSDYFVIAEREYTQKMHTDLPATHLRGYIQLDPNTGADIGTIQYLGPIIVAQKDRPVRIKLVNQLSIGQNGNLPLPVDHTYMGSTGDTDNRTAMHLHGGNTPWISDGTPRQWIKPSGEVGNNRGESARNIPDMWFDASGNLIPSCTGQTLCTEAGASNDAGEGTLTFYYTNEQSARLMFYHDHAEGITRLNVYAGLAAGYILQDQTEQDLVNGTNLSGNNPSSAQVLPEDQIPLIIQEKTFVPDKTKPVINFYGPFASALQSQDPTWNWGSGTVATGLNGNGDLWVPHIFMPNQNPGDPSGANPVGRWDYGPWFWPPFVGIQNGPIANPYYDPLCNATTGTNVNPLLGTCEGEFIPGVPNGAKDVYGVDNPLGQPSGQPEAFNDTMTVNGTVYPYTEVEPKKYRLRILSVGNDRHLNLSMVVASSKNTDTTADANFGPTNTTAFSNTCDGAHLGSIASAECTEVRMVPWNSIQNKAANTPFPSWWYSFMKTGVVFDGRPSGVFSPNVRGPAMVQIGTEGGFLSSPTVIKNQPINYEYNVKNIVVGNVKEHALLLGPAERADVVVDFSQFAGSTIILYNDAPAALPAGDLRLDYFTGDYDNTDTGGAFSTLPGFGPNTRTVMQFRVTDTCTSANCGTGINRTPSNSHPVDDVDQTYMTQLTTAVRNAFKTSQEPVIVPQSAYNSVYGTNVSDLLGTNLSSISGSEFTYGPLNLDANGIATGLLDPAVTLTFQPKSIIEDWTVDYGRMNAMLGVEMPHTTAINQTSIPQGYIDPATELVKISENGVPISGELADGTQIWKITHNGVDTHPVHFHLFHVQLINRVGWDGAVTNPQPNELGWKDTIRMNPLEDVIVALRPKTLTLPFKVGNSHRVMDPSNPGPDINTAMSFNFSPISGNASNITNDKIANFGWEYAWHCHILGHEENDFMRPISVAHAPENPTATSSVGETASVTVNWKDNSMVSNWVQIQRDTVDTFDSPNLATFNVTEPECADQAGCDRSYIDTTAPVATTVYYRIQSNNTVGMGNGILENGYNQDGTYVASLPPELSTLTPGFTGYSNATAASNWSNSVSRVVQPVAQVTAGPLTFTDQLVNTESAAQTVTVTNTGNGNLAISSVALTTNTDFVIVNNCPASLAPTANCTIDVTFKPTATGALSDTLSITDNSSSGPNPQTVQLSGSGIAPYAALDVTTLDLGGVNVGVTSAAQSVTLTNNGTAPLTISNITVSTPFANAVSGTCSTAAQVPVSGSCTIIVNFTPTATGAATGTIIITDNANGILTSTQQVNLTGTGTAPNAAITPPSLDFGNVILGGTSAIQSATLTNNGDGPLTISTIVTAAPFAIVAGGTCTDGAQVPASGSCIINVTFTPTSGGNASGTLTVTDDSQNFANSTQTVTLSGVGAVPVAEVSAPLNFGDIDVATTSAPLTATVTNSGNAPLAISSMTVNGQFVLAAGGTCSTLTPVAAGANCAINVTFSPTSAGLKTGTLTITDNSNGIPGSSQTVVVSGNGIVIPPAAPSSVTIERTSATVARVSWLDNSINEASFQVQSSTNGGTSWTTVATSTSTATQQTGTGARSVNVNVTATTNAIYRVVAVRRTPPTPAVTTPSSNTASLNNTLSPATPVITSSSTQIVSATAAGVTINWQDIANNNASYRVDRCLRTVANLNCTSATATWTTLTNSAGDTVTWTSLTQARARAYTYRISAVNGAFVASTKVDIPTP